VLGWVVPLFAGKIRRVGVVVVSVRCCGTPIPSVPMRSGIVPSQSRRG
jgi:hypothetical protein